MNLDTYYKTIGTDMDASFEGHCQRCPAEADTLKKIVQTYPIRSILEIGFNAGHSAEIFLKNNPEAHVISFDLGEHEYGEKGKVFIDLTYPNRHTLILGDSRQTIPKFYQENPTKKFDMIFIDGGHSNGIPLADLRNCRKLAHSNTILVFDDVKKTYIQWYNTEPTQVWNEYASRNLITEYKQYDFSPTHGLAYGKYNLCELVVCSLLRDDRRVFIKKNQNLYPNLRVFPSVNGYDIDATLSELKKINVPYHSLGFKTYGTLANWITKYKVLQYQVEHTIEYLCFIEDDLLLTMEFEDFINDAIEHFKDPELNMIRLNRWGEGYITSYSSAKRLLQMLTETGIVLNIDDQLREKSGKELYLPNAHMKLQVMTNNGDCLKTKSFDTL